jgi:hypothetical protein
MSKIKRGEATPKLEKILENTLHNIRAMAARAIDVRDGKLLTNIHKQPKEEWALETLVKIAKMADKALRGEDKDHIEAIRKVVEDYKDAPYHDPFGELTTAEATIDKIKTILQI